MKRCVAIAPTIVATSAKAPNTAIEGTSSASAEPTSMRPVR